MQMCIWVPSPLEGEGQDEGETVTRLRLPLDTLSLASSIKGEGRIREAPCPPPRFVPNSIAPRAARTSRSAIGLHFLPLRACPLFVSRVPSSTWPAFTRRFGT